MINKSIGRDIHYWINNIPSGLCIFTFKKQYPYFQISAWNKWMEDITGYNFEDINEENLKKLFAIKEYSIEPMKTFVEGMYRSNDKKEKTFKILTKNSISKTICIDMSVTNYEEEIYSVTALVKDITVQMKKEEELREIEKRYKSILENSTDAIFIFGDWKFIYANEKGLKLLGYEKLENIIGQPIFKNIHADFHPIVKGRIKYSHDKEGSVPLMEQKYLTCSGEVIDVESQTTFITYKGKKCNVSFVRDITERKKKEKMIKGREKRYRQLVEALPYGVYIWSKGEALFSNKVGLEYIGLSSLNELKDKRYEGLLKPHPSYEEGYKKSLELLRKNGRMPLTEEKFIRVADNKILDVETIITKYTWDENDNALLSVTRDISDRIKAEALEKDMIEKSKQLDQVAQYERLRTEFFANISHELRTPVNVIFSALQLMNFNIKELKTTKELDKYLDIMKQNCYRLVRLINNLIDVTKIDSGYFNINLVNTNIVSIVEDITLSVAEYIAVKGISLVFDTEMEEKILACDPDKIERIMLNLISNAVKFTKPGGTLFVSIKDRGESVLISVKDTGIGISKDKQKIIFERFIQVDKSLTRKNEGSGIGLSLVKSLVELHNGNITVESELDEGSEFIVELPVRVVAEGSDNLSTNDYLLQGNVEKINIEFSDIYF